MLLLDRQSDATTQPRGTAFRAAKPASRIQLRLRADGRLLDLLPGKTTIGSSPRCNVRIEYPGIQPLHCLIIEGVEEWRIRSWVADSTLNGEPFEESPLLAGDCLCLGQVELDVFDPEAKTPDLQPTSMPAVALKGAEQIRVGRDQARVRGRQLLKALRNERSAQRRLSEQVAKLQESHLDAIVEQNETSRELEGCLAELAIVREQLKELDGHVAVRHDLEQRNEQLGIEISELSTKVHELSQSHLLAGADYQHIADERAELQEQLQQSVEARIQLQSELEQWTNERLATREQYDQLRDSNTQLQNDSLQVAAEKAEVDERNRQLAERVSRLQNEFERLANQKENLEAEREGLRRQNEQLQCETREIATERGVLLDDQASLRQERSELRHQNESLRDRIEQLNDEQSALAVNNLKLEEERDTLTRQAEQFQAQVTKLTEENASLATAKSSLADEQARLVAEQKRLAELEREIGEAIAERENTSAELYRALLQISEMQERDDQHKEAIAAYKLLREEREQTQGKLALLDREIQRLIDEQKAAETAWQELTGEAASLDQSRQQLAIENTALVARLDELQQQLVAIECDRAVLKEMAEELERERATRSEVETASLAVQAESKRRLEEQEQHFAELSQGYSAQSQQLVEQSQRFEEQLRLQSVRVQELVDTVGVLEQQLDSSRKSREMLVHAQEVAELRLADAESNHDEQLRQIDALEIQLSLAQKRVADVEEIAARQAAALQMIEAERLIKRDELPCEPVIDRREIAQGAAIVEEPEQAECNCVETIRDESAWEPVSSELLHDAPESAEFSRLEEKIVEEGVQPVAEASSSLGLLWRPTSESMESESTELLFANEAEAAPPVKREPSSFIDRYAHLLDENKSETQSSITSESASNPFAIPRGESTPKKEDSYSAMSGDDESIEQYMAKLLQRMRGDDVAAKEAPKELLPIDTKAFHNVERATDEAVDGVSPTLENSEDESVDALELLKRHVVAATPKTDLNALRALANETTRMAISRRDLKLLRHSATTKMIIATLAGATGTWLAFHSSDWRSLPAMAAGVTLLMATYWGMETVRTLFRLKRAINSALEVAAMAFQGKASMLPIDVEGDLAK